MVDKNTKFKLQDELFTEKCFQYSVKQDQWRRLLDFPIKIACASACSHNGLLYVIGGVKPSMSVEPGHGLVTTSRMHAYDSQSGLWLDKPAMNYPRCKCAM